MLDISWSTAFAIVVVVQVAVRFATRWLDGYHARFMAKHDQTLLRAFESWHRIEARLNEAQAEREGKLERINGGGNGVRVES